MSSLLRSLGYGLIVYTLMMGGGCASTQSSSALEQELRELRARVERLTEKPSSSPVAAQSPFTTPAGPSQRRAPSPGAPPPLPMVKLSPTHSQPSAEHGEPIIRVGGRVATSTPKSLTASRKGYRKLNADGAVLDHAGDVLYRPDTPVGDNDSEPMAADRRYEDDPHEAPSSRIDRFLAVPMVEEPRARGVQRLKERKLKEFVLREGPLPFERDDAIVVNDDTRPSEAELNGEQLSDWAGQQASTERYHAELSRQQKRAEDRQKRAQRIRDKRLEKREKARALREARKARKADAERKRRERLEALRAERRERKAQERAKAQAAAADRAAKREARRAKAAEIKKTIRNQVRYTGRRQRLVTRLYDRGITALRSGQMEDALRDLATLIGRYPDHELADNAVYWTGEIAYAAENWLSALTWFQDLIIRYPNANKLPDAMLKSAYCYERLGDTSYAVKLLTEVTTRFSGTPIAKLAEKKKIMILSETNGGE